MSAAVSPRANHHISVNAAVTALSASLASLVWCVPVQGQTVVNPRVVTFAASPDHNARMAGGEEILSRYDLELFEEGASQPIVTLNLGKPAPTPDGIIAVEFVSLLDATPEPDRTLQARVAAVGPGGAGVSDVSNVFTFTGCVAQAAPDAFTMPAAGANGTVQIGAADSCAWDAWSTAAWIAITGGEGGQGSAALAFAVGPNPTGASRSGTLVVGGLVVQVTQQAGVAQPGTAQMPGVFLRQPADGATFGAPAQVPLYAVFAASPSSVPRSTARPDENATSPVVDVHFYANGAEVGVASSPPFGFLWQNVPAGTYELVAVATTVGGAQVASAPVTITVK